MEGKYTYAVYEDFREATLAEIRREAFGEDIGQFSWIVAVEFRRFLDVLGVVPESVLLDVACGAGGLALCAAKETGCRVIGVDLSEEAIATASKAAADHGLEERMRFLRQDARRPLPLEGESVDAIICIDAINHIVNRKDLLVEWKRVLRPGGRFLFTDATIVAGVLSRDEILARSNRMGDFYFTPLGSHERVIGELGFEDVRCEDVTDTIAATAQRWYEARARRREALLRIEPAEQHEDLQSTLHAAATLASEGRMLRIAYSGMKPPFPLP